MRRLDRRQHDTTCLRHQFGLPYIKHPDPWSGESSRGRREQMTNEEKTRESNLEKAARKLGRPVAPKPRESK